MNSETYQYSIDGALKKIKSNSFNVAGSDTTTTTEFINVNGGKRDRQAAHISGVFRPSSGSENKEYDKNGNVIRTFSDPVLRRVIEYY